MMSLFGSTTDSLMFFFLYKGIFWDEIGFGCSSSGGNS